MLSTVRRKLAMAVRALDFAHAHASADTGYVAVVTRLEQAVSRGQLLAVQENSGQVTAHAATRRRATLRRQMHVLQLKHLIQVGKAAARVQPDLTGKFVMPQVNPQNAFITAARVMIAIATANRDLFLATGLGDHFLDDFGKSLTEFDTTTDQAHAGKRDHVGARRELSTVIGECVECVNLLDGLIRATYPAGTEEIGAWESARKVAGPFTKPRPVVTEPVAPSSPVVVLPADRPA